jgi:hypothetical protein
VVHGRWRRIFAIPSVQTDAASEPVPVLANSKLYSLGSRGRSVGAQRFRLTVLAASMHSPGHQWCRTGGRRWLCGRQVTVSQIDMAAVDVRDDDGAPRAGVCARDWHAAWRAGLRLDAGGTTIVKTEFFVHRGAIPLATTNVAQLAAACGWCGSSGSESSRSEFALLPGHPVGGQPAARIATHAVGSTAVDGLAGPRKYTFRGSNRSAGASASGRREQQVVWRWGFRRWRHAFCCAGR